MRSIDKEVYSSLSFTLHKCIFNRYSSRLHIDKLICRYENYCFSIRPLRLAFLERCCR